MCAVPSLYLLFFTAVVCQEGVLSTEHEQILVQHTFVF